MIYYLLVHETDPRHRPLVQARLHRRRFSRPFASDDDDNIHITWHIHNDRDPSMYITESRFDETYVRWITKKQLESIRVPCTYLLTKAI